SRDTVEPSRIDGMIIVDQVRGLSLISHNIAELIRVFTVAGADHQDQVDPFSKLFYRVLTVLRGIADVFLSRGDQLGKASSQDVDDISGIVNAQSGLGKNHEFVGIGYGDPLRFIGVGHNLDFVRGFSAGPDNFVVLFMTDKNDRIARAGELPNLPVYFFHKRAGGINNGSEFFFLRLLPDGWRNAVRAEDQFCSGGNFVDGLNEAHAALGKIPYHVNIVNDFVKDIDRRTMAFKRPFDSFDRHLYARTKAARCGEYHV